MNGCRCRAEWKGFFYENIIMMKISYLVILIDLVDLIIFISAYMSVLVDKPLKIRYDITFLTKLSQPNSTST